MIEIDKYQFITNWVRANKYFGYHIMLSQRRLKPLFRQHPILVDIRQSLHFRGVLYLANFFQQSSPTNLRRLLKYCKKVDLTKERIILLHSDPRTQCLLNLRNKQIAHADTEWYKYSLKFSDESAQYFLTEIRQLIELSFDTELDHMVPNILEAVQAFGQKIR